MASLVSGDKEAQISGDPGSKRGGWITFPFMLATLLGLSVTSFGWVMNLIVFLIEEFNIKSIAAAQISNVANGCLSMLPVVAAILADSFFGNIPVIAASSFISLLGIVLLTLIASLDYLRPRPCEAGSVLCTPPSKLHLGILYTALALVTTGAGGTRFTMASAGANQYEKPKEQGSFFNWYFLTLYAGAITGATAIVYIQDNASWKLGFGLCAAANLISFIVFVSGKRYYKHDKPMGSPFTSLIRVVVSATVKRKAVISCNEEDYHHYGLEKEVKTSAAMPSKSFRFLNRAALMTKDDLNQKEGSVNNIWRLCSVQEVEDFKAILRVFPLWLSIIFVSTPMVMQTSLIVLQALVTDRGLGPNFKVPAGSLQVIIIITACIVIIMNNWLVFPMYKKLTHKLLTPLQKVGIGQVLTILSMALSAVVEAKRLKTVENGHPMSVLWLFPPLVIVGIGEAFQFPANIELFYGEFPESLRNTATSLTSVVIGISFYLSTALIDLIQRTTAWLPNDINHGRVDNVYWLLVIGGILNFGYFLVCSWVYKYRNLKDNDQEQDPKENILGIIYYIRFTWIVGMAGIGQGLVLVFLCGLCTFLTTISLSAIATNGAMKGGGPYYLIGRALGPEVGISIGLCFFLGNAVAGALYVLGAVETFLKAFPAAGIFRETITKVNGTAVSESIQSPNSHDLQVYGIVVTILLCFIVFGGVKMINRVAPAFLVPVLLSIFCIFIGIFLAKTDDPDNGITGLRLKSFKDNWGSAYQMTNDAGIPDPTGGTYWSFNELVGLFFPAVTGIMAGSNRSASLKDTQKSIPVGTLAATLTTTSLYLISVLFFGAVATRDKLLTDRLLTATIAWPFPAIVHVGIILSTLGAALQSLTGAPRLLAAIANDDILPILNYFKVADTSEPHIATLFTAFICIGCVVIGNLDLITPTVTMFYLLCYSGVNLSCFLLDLLDAPSWRPRWKYHHWSLSFVGASLCIVIMFLISWSFTVVAIALASLIYKYVGLKGKAGDWGDGFKSAYFQLALRSLRSLGANQVHPKNWYPIPLVFCRPWGQLPENVPCHPKLADFANCMKKKGRGMSIFVSILDGDYYECAEEAKEACKQLATYIEYKRCEGVAEIVVAPNMTEGFRGIIQTMGLGNLKPNIVVMRYPEIWRRENLTEIPSTFVGIINDCITANKAVVIIKGLDEWPNEYQRQYGTIDLYWIVRDGGLMLLLSQLLLTKESFESCKIQLFCIAEEDSDAEALKADVKKFLYDLRMHAEVIVVTMKSWDIRSEGNSQEDSLEAFDAAQRRISDYLGEIKRQGSNPLLANGKPMVVNEQQVEKFLYTMLKLNSTILSYSRMAAVVLVSLPPPPLNHPAYFYMEYMDLLVENVPRMLIVRGYHRDVVTLFT